MKFLQIAPGRPAVDWTRRDLDDLGPPNSGMILYAYHHPRYGHADPLVFRSWVALSTLREELWEERERSTYDWSEYGPDGAFPPIKLVVRSDGGLFVADGNHRIRYWKTCGYTRAPAWVLDYRRGVSHEIRA